MSRNQYLILWLAVIGAFGMILLPLVFRLFWLAKALLIPAVVVLLVTVNWAFNTANRPRP